MAKRLGSERSERTEEPENGGAYRLYIRLDRTVVVEVGTLGRHRLEAGSYVYVGSARRGLRQRVARHARLGKSKQGRRHWHIDALLIHPDSRLTRTQLLPGGDECELSRALAARADSSVPVPGFGATDCRWGCPSHLYRVADK